MLKELIQFTNSLDSEIKAVGMVPKEGLHIMFNLKSDPEIIRISGVPAYEVFSKKMKEVSLFMKRCEFLLQSSWMIDTNKCLDNITRAIHSCSPFCLAIKKDNLVGGKNYEQRKKEKKPIVYNSLDNYFSKASKLAENELHKVWAQTFSDTLNSESKIHNWLANIPEYKNIKDNEYVIFYLNLEIEDYLKVYTNYFTDELIFNKAIHNTLMNKEWFGASGFLNGFNNDKPFLKHQSATFDIAGRISAKEARSLFEFENLISRRTLSGQQIFPMPLPIFIYEDERNASIALFKRDVLEGGGKRGYREIIEELQDKLKKELGNYYLLFYQMGEVKDFDFVSKFEYNLTNAEDNNWYIADIFGSRYTPTLTNVFDFERIILPIIFNNALIVRTKTKSILFKYFDDIDVQYCKTPNTFLLVMKYRKTLYDFIYKSNRTGFTQKAFKDVLLTSVMDDISLDKYENNRHSEDLNIRQKLNILFSLHQNFQPFKTDTLFMATQITDLQQSLDALAAGESNISSDEQFAFAAGQVIYYILSKSKSSDKSYARLEPFLQLNDTERLKQTLIKIFGTYKHENFSRRFSNPFAQVLAYTTISNLKDLMPLMLAGFFSKNQLFGKGKEDEQVINEQPQS